MGIIHIEVGRQLEIWIKGDDHDTFVVAVIYDRIDCWTCCESYNLLSLAPANLAYMTLLSVCYN